MSRLDQELASQLAARQDAGLLRRVRQIPPRVLDLASNDYLGLSRHENVIEAACRATRIFGTGARASQLVSGRTELHSQLEGELARFKGTQSALLFSSGYAANIGVITALSHAGDTFFCDKRNHASLLDACKMAQSSGATVRYYSNLEKLRSLLQTSRTRLRDTPSFIVTDGVYSMDGDLCDWPQLVELARESGATLILDDAHGTGTLGASGHGTRENFGVDTSGVDIVEIGTLSKALGAQGGFVVGSQTLIDYFINASRSFVYSTALSPMICGAALESLRVLERELQRLTSLRDATTRLAFGLRQLGYEVRAHPSPILSVLVGDANQAVALSERLLELGVWCPAIRPPTVPRGTSRLRVTASATLSEQDIERALAAFAEAKRVLI